MIIGYIYSLQCPKTNEVKYIGGTIYPGNRLYCHLRSPKFGNKPLHQWIASLQAEDCQPIMSILYTCDKKDISKYEHKFFEFYTNLGCALFNEKGYKEQHDIIDTIVLKKIIQSKQIKIKDLSDKLGVNRTSISSYLKHKSSIKIEKAKELNDYILSLV